MLHAHRAPVTAGEQRGERFEAHIELGPEAPADVMAHHPHRRRRHAQHLGHPVSQPEGVLVGDLDGVAARFVGRERHLRFQVRLILPGSAVGALHHQVGGCERRVEVAGVVDYFGHHVAVTPDVGASDNDEAVPVRVDEAGPGRQCLLGRRDGFGRLDVDADGCSARLSGCAAVGHHERDGLAFVGHVVGSQEGNVVDDHAGAPIGHVRCSEHVVYAVDPQRRSAIDGANASGRHGRAGNCRPQHPRPREVGAEDRLAPQLRIGIAALRAGPERAHDAAASAAASAASTICW